MRVAPKGGREVSADFLRKVLFLPEQASTAAPEIDHLHYFVIITTFVASIAVGLTAVFFFIKYRRRSEFQKTPHIEATWWMETLIILTPATFFLVWFGLGFTQLVRIQTPPPNTLDVYVMGKQWMWKYAYPGGPSAVETLHVPVGRPVRLLLTSRDVIHSFYVPAFRLKMDALPGRYTEMWFEVTKPGRYRVLCAEYCGTQHATMWGEIVAMPPEEFDTWLAEQRKAMADQQDQGPAPDYPGADSPMVREGWRVAAEKGCFKCHTTDGTAHLAPSFYGMYGSRRRTLTGQEVTVDEAYITESVMDPMAHIVVGYQPIMPSFRGLVTPAETASIVELIKSLQTHKVTTPEAPAYELQPRR